MKEFKVSDYLKWYEYPYYWVLNTWDAVADLFVNRPLPPYVPRARERKETWYVAGPMSGLPQFNHPKFHEVTRLLRERGLTVINPAEEDSVQMQELAMASPDGNVEVLVEPTGETWGDVLARDVRLIANKVTNIILLPGWENSKGARLELYVSKLCGHGIYIWCEESDTIQHVSTESIRAGLEL